VANQPWEMAPEVAEAIRGALGRASEHPDAQMVTRWAAVIEVVGQDGKPHLERVCEPGMNGWDMRGFFHEASSNDGWEEEPDDA
jgi:hypothetical protein